MKGRKPQPKRIHIGYETRLMLLALASSLPAVLAAEWLLWTGSWTAKVQWTLSLFVIGGWISGAYSLRERIVRPLQTAANLLAALHEEDYSVRARGAGGDDALGELLAEVNALGRTLREQKLGALEATTLLRTVMAEIDVAVFAFDIDKRLRLVNRAGERLLAQPSERLIHRTADALGLGGCLAQDGERTMNLSFPGAGPGGVGRYGVRHGYFRAQGERHHLLVLTDLSQALRDEERQAWQRLVRVLGHELNNSLAPIKSIAGSLQSLLQRQPRPEDWEEDVGRGLDVIASRAEALSRFMQAYARLARLPQPKLALVPLRVLIERVVKLDTHFPIQLHDGPEVTIQADGDQLEQLLINLLRNAVEASEENGGQSVEIGWRQNGYLEIWVVDSGPGVANPANLFVPFFTTKPQGSGIGLVLSRQIAEAHGGSLTLENKAEGKGCVARLRLPL